MQRHPGLHRQPDPDPAPERLRARARRGARRAGRRRPRDALRRELADRALRADRPDRHRRPRPRVGGPARGARRGADGPARRLVEMAAGRASSAARPAAGSPLRGCGQLGREQPGPDVLDQARDRGRPSEAAKSSTPAAKTSLRAGSRSRSSPRSCSPIRVGIAREHDRARRRARGCARRSRSRSAPNVEPLRRPVPANAHGAGVAADDVGRLPCRSCPADLLGADQPRLGPAELAPLVHAREQLPVALTFQKKLFADRNIRFPPRSR